MNCANCQYNNGAVYTSIPPQYKCTITGKFHFGANKCDVEFAPIKHGQWVKDPQNDPYSLYKCSACNEFCTGAGWANCIPKERMYKAFKYCPNCGAKMNEVTE